MEQRTYWLSFLDEQRPAGQRFLGVCVVDVDADDAEAVRDELIVKFPNHAEGAEWIAAAIRAAHEMGCNPGGQVASVVVPASCPAPRNRLLSKADVERLEQTQLKT